MYNLNQQMLKCRCVVMSTVQVLRASSLVSRVKRSAAIKRQNTKPSGSRRDRARHRIASRFASVLFTTLRPCKMNATNGATVPPGLWQEARNADGRVYYYNVQTKATQWQKPLELMTPAEVQYFPNLGVFLLTLTILCSARLRTNHGRSIRLKVGASTGTILRRSKARGRCPRCIRPPLRKVNQRRDHLQRK